MGFTSISTYSYRNLQNQRVSLKARRIFLVGENGQGKSNFLEAVYLLSYGSSFRTNRENELITHGTREMALNGRYARPEEDYIEGSVAFKLSRAGRPGQTIGAVGEAGSSTPAPDEVPDSNTAPAAAANAQTAQNPKNAAPAASTTPSKEKTKEKIIELDGTRIHDRKQLISHLPAIVFSHDDIYFVNGPPERRRWFFNQTLSLFDPLFIDTLRDYRKILKMRNLALKDQRRDLIPIYDQQLATAGLEIQRRRADLINDFNRVVAPIFEQVSTISEPLTIEYRPSWPAGPSTASRPANIAGATAAGLASDAAKNASTAAAPSALNQNPNQNPKPNPDPAHAPKEAPDGIDQVCRLLEEKREQDLLYGTTSSGPHRDRFIFRLAGSDFARIASTGQLRLMSLILRIGQCRYFSEKTGRRPILLLDDVLLELDSERRKRFLAQLPEYEQAFFTFLPDEKYLELAGTTGNTAATGTAGSTGRGPAPGEPNAPNEPNAPESPESPEHIEPTAVYWVENGWIQKMNTTSTPSPTGPTSTEGPPGATEPTPTNKAASTNNPPASQQGPTSSTAKPTNPTPPNETGPTK